MCDCPEPDARLDVHTGDLDCVSGGEPVLETCWGRSIDLGCDLSANDRADCPVVGECPLGYPQEL